MRAMDPGHRARGKGRGNSIRPARCDGRTIHPASRPSRALGHIVPQHTEIDRFLDLERCRELERSGAPRGGAVSAVAGLLPAPLTLRR